MEELKLKGYEEVTR
ncbi:hypothetical protein AB8X56_15675 [Listeria monocytogenes]